VRHGVFALGLRLLTRWLQQQRRVPLELHFILEGETV
jgi:hypothetical protein